MPSIAVILPAAGQSSRFGDSHRKKPFIELKGRPVWVRAIEPFVNHPDVKQSIVVVSAEDMEWFQDKFRPNLAFMNVDVVEGGADRCESVANGLAAVKDSIDFVAVHDAARPLLVKKWIDEVYTVAQKSGAAIPATRISSTVKRVKNGVIDETVPRDHLWAAQTPQIFSRELLVDAYAKRSGATTDDAQLVEALGKPVSIVESSPLNIKITTKEDFRMAEALLGALPQEKTFKSLHPFAEDNPHLFDNL